MNFRDPDLHRQLNEFAKSARQAVAGDRAVIVIRAYDDIDEKYGNVILYDHVDEELPSNKVHAEILLDLMSAACTVLESIGHELWIKDEHGEMRRFRVDDPTSLSIEL